MTLGNAKLKASEPGKIQASSTEPLTKATGSVYALLYATTAQKAVYTSSATVRTENFLDTVWASSWHSCNMQHTKHLHARNYCPHPPPPPKTLQTQALKKFKRLRVQAWAFRVNPRTQTSNSRATGLPGLGPDWALFTSNDDQTSLFRCF